MPSCRRQLVRMLLLLSMRVCLCSQQRCLCIGLLRRLRSRFGLYLRVGRGLRRPLRPLRLHVQRVLRLRQQLHQRETQVAQHCRRRAAEHSARSEYGLQLMA